LIWLGGAYNGSTHGAGIAVNTLEPPQEDAIFGKFIGEIEADNTRPSAPKLGRVFFDRSIDPARPIWYDGSNWVDAVGNAV
jgi:hypothetical protein